VDSRTIQCNDNIRRFSGLHDRCWSLDGPLGFAPCSRWVVRRFGGNYCLRLEVEWLWFTWMVHVNASSWTKISYAEDGGSTFFRSVGTFHYAAQKPKEDNQRSSNSLSVCSAAVTWTRMGRDMPQAAKTTAAPWNSVKVHFCAVLCCPIC
jgi:hypothetical protein